MANDLCGPSNALQNFQKQTSVERTLQQDRLTAPQAPAESFRSAPGPNAGILDAEFEAFQAGHPLQAGHPEPDLYYRGPLTDPLQEHYGESQFSNWASDFQNLHLNEARALPVPQSQFRRHASLQRTTQWQQVFFHQQNQPSRYKSQQQQIRAGPNHSGWSYGYTGGLMPQMPQHSDTLSPLAQQKQPERQVEDVFDEAAFERAFDMAKEEMQQSKESAHQKENQLDARLHDTNDRESRRRLDHRRIGSDRVLDEAQNRQEEGEGADDEEELARTAAQLLENVKSDQSHKFKESNFLSLMRQLRDKEVRVEGDKLVDISQPLHPGGEHYPSEGSSRNPSDKERPDNRHKDAGSSFAAVGLRFTDEPLSDAEETALLYRHLARNYRELLRANDIYPNELVQIAQSLLKDAGFGPEHLSHLTIESSEETDTPAEYKSIEATVKRIAGESIALQTYQRQLMLLEQQNKKRLLMARQEQGAMNLGHTSGHLGDEQAS